MKNIIIKEIEYMKYILGYKRGVVISEQPIKKTSLSEQQSTEGCIDGDCDNRKGTYKYSSGSEYTGEWKDGLFNGQGTFTKKNGSTWSGEFKNNELFNGKITYKSSNGDNEYIEVIDGVKGEKKNDNPAEQNNNKEESTTGCVTGNCKDGKGTFNYTDSSSHTGQWKDNVPNGQGTYILLYSDKSIMYKNTGEWKDGDLYNGYKIDFNPDGTNEYYYEVKNGEKGELIYGKPPEQNKETEQNNNKEESKTGCVTGNCEDGKGTYKWSDGTVYTGLWKDSKHNGKGSYKFADGTTEETGEFKNNDLYNGYKIFSDFYYEVINGDNGDFINGKPPEQNKETEQNNDQSKTGECTGNCKDGEGTYKDKDRVYTGEFKDGDLYNGLITFTSQDGISKYSEVKDGEQGPLQDGKPPNNATNLNNATAQNNSGDCVQPTKPTHRYKNDKNYQYAKSGDCWWAKNITNNKWFNLTELVKTKPKVQSSIDKLNDGTDLIKL